MNPALLLLADSRLPAGGHAHSGGTEQAITSGAVSDVPSLARFLRGRLHTTGALAATLTAAAHTHATTTPPQPTSSASTAATEPAPGTALPGTGSGLAASPWVLLDAEVDARTAAPAQRDASRTQGRLLLRVARRVWPSPVLEELARAVPSPHHPIVLGAVAYAAGATAEEAAMAAAYHAISGPATAAVRLLGLDPVAVHGLLAELTPDLTAIATEAHLAVTKARSTAGADADSTAHPAAANADSPAHPAVADTDSPVADTDSPARPGLTSQTPDPADPRPWLAALPAYSSPALDLLAEQHARAEVRLFVS
ncbi:urease accessory UreF family protein [Nonomuraea angiospora]|uniref:urease accessory protein UreF n=1 Tax=Nonomuraea angiospora TaxID=46172 RepID=UPI0034342054